MNKKKIFITILSVLTALVIVAAVSERKTHFVNKFVDDIILDNRNYYLPCDQLPTFEEVNGVVLAHKDAVEKIIKEAGKRYHNSEVTPIWKEHSVRDGEDYFNVEFSWNRSSSHDSYCPNGGDIEITYPAHQDRVIIENIINGDTFFGIPYKLTNI